MAVNLSKGEHVNLTKSVPSLREVTVALGWDMAERGYSVDCDSSVFLLRESKSGLFGRKSQTPRLLDHDDIVYYGNKRHRNGCVIHHGDNLTGAGDGDDEQISVDLANMPSDVSSVVVAINIYDCVSRRQHFGMIRNCYARIIDDNTGTEICRYNLSSDYNKKTAVVIGTLDRHNDGWVFNAVGEGYNDDSIGALAHRYR